jgi:metal-dependent amidase/aminoacylase/carboxypeptidase family protein
MSMDEIDIVSFKGKSAHGSTPELGVNAALRLLRRLALSTKSISLASFIPSSPILMAKASMATPFAGTWRHDLQLWHREIRWQSL